MTSLFPSSQNFLTLAIEELIKSNISTILIVILILFIIWLLVREIKTWYWKINDIVSLLKRIDDNTRFLANKKGMKESNGEADVVFTQTTIENEKR